MKKYLLLLSTALAFILAPVAANANVTAGITISSNTLDTAGSEDVDNNGTIDDRKNVSDDFTVGSIFLEATKMGDKFGVTFGVDYIPFDADIDKRSISQSSVKGKNDGAATTGNNSVEGSIQDHTTFYIQPGMMVGDNSMLYLSYGFVTMDFQGRSVSLSHTDITETKSVDGEKTAVGIKRVADNGLVLKLEASETTYDAFSFTTSNNTKATADLDNTAITFSIGKQF